MPYTTIVETNTVYQHMEDPAWVIIDCRFQLNDPDAGYQMYLEAHIPGACYAHLDRDLSGPPGGDAGRHPLPDIEVFRATLGRWGITSGKQVVCYDDLGGAFAARLWWMLRYLGHEAVAVLDGGWQAWVRRGHPVRGGQEEVAPTRFEGEPRPEMLASYEDVEKAMGGDGVLVDARDAGRYRGEFEPIDARAGHIPGARNRPFRQNLSDDHTTRPVDVLLEEWRAILGDAEPGDVISYCGSGVTACHNLLMMEHAGLRGARLFVPSWSGWSSDPSRRVETGGQEE